MLFQHPDIIDAAVVGKKDKKWGEVPCAFITLKKNSSLTEQQKSLIFVGPIWQNLKFQKKLFLAHIEKTLTGKIQKFLLRKKANQK